MVHGSAVNLQQHSVPVDSQHFSLLAAIYVIAQFLFYAQSQERVFAEILDALCARSRPNLNSVFFQTDEELIARASVWSAWSLLPLSERAKAAASRAHSKRFAPSLGLRWKHGSWKASTVFDRALGP